MHKPKIKEITVKFEFTDDEETKLIDLLDELEHASSISVEYNENLDLTKHILKKIVKSR